MKNPTLLLLLLSLCSLHLVYGGVGSMVHEIRCCENTSHVKIPLKFIVTYRKTSVSCPLQAIVFKIRSGKEWCIDPSARWLDRHMTILDRRNATSTPNTESQI